MIVTQYMTPNWRILADSNDRIVMLEHLCCWSFVSIHVPRMPLKEFLIADNIFSVHCAVCLKLITAKDVQEEFFLTRLGFMNLDSRSPTVFE